MNKILMEHIFSTQSDWSGTVLRLVLAGVIFPHAVQKLFGWFNGPGLSGEMHFMTQTVGLPYLVAILAITIECTATLLLILGFATKIAALGLFCLFTGMIIFVHAPHGFFMNWFGKLPSGHEGFEYHILVLGICLGLLIEGAGNLSLDKLVQNYLQDTL